MQLENWEWLCFETHTTKHTPIETVACFQLANKSLMGFGFAHWDKLVHFGEYNLFTNKKVLHHFVHN